MVAINNDHALRFGRHRRADHRPPPANALSGPVQRKGLYDGIHGRWPTQGQAIVLICGGRTINRQTRHFEFRRPAARRMVGLNGPSRAIENATCRSSPPFTARRWAAAAWKVALGPAITTASRCRAPAPDLLEVKLGLQVRRRRHAAPAASGRAEKALALMTSGDQISAAEAVKSASSTPWSRAIQHRSHRLRQVGDGKPSPARARPRREKVAADRGNAELFAAFRKERPRLPRPGKRRS